MVLVGVMLSGVGVLAYRQTFYPPRVGSGRVIESQVASGSMSPYVYQNVYSVETLYVLTPLSTYTYSTLATNSRSTAIPQRLNLTYNTGYGGAGTKLYLQGCPYVNAYNAYTVTGSWGA